MSRTVIAMTGLTVWSNEPIEAVNRKLEIARETMGMSEDGGNPWGAPLVMTQIVFSEEPTGSVPAMINPATIIAIYTHPDDA